MTKPSDWELDRYLENYKQYAEPFDAGVIAWDGLLLDGWKESGKP